MIQKFYVNFNDYYYAILPGWFENSNTFLRTGIYLPLPVCELWGDTVMLCGEITCANYDLLLLLLLF